MQNITIQPFNLIGISIKTTNKDNQASEEIGQLWQRFLGEQILDKIPNKIDHTVYSLYTEYEGDHTEPYTTILGCKVSTLEEIPEGMTGKSFAGGNYVKLTAKGDLMQGLIVNKWTEIFGMNLDRNYVADFEAFGEKAQNPNDAEVDFFVGVK